MNNIARYFVPYYMWRSLTEPFNPTIVAIVKNPSPWKSMNIFIFAFTFGKPSQPHCHEWGQILDKLLKYNN